MPKAKGLTLTRNVTRVTTVGIMLALVAVATADGFAQSYSGLYEWALAHRLSGWKAQSFPLLVDLFILIGELGLFLLAVDGYKVNKRSMVSIMDLLVPAGVAATGWTVSLWFNINHMPYATVEDKITAGVPPVAAMIGLFILLRTLHRYMSQLDARVPTVLEPEPLARTAEPVAQADAVPALVPAPTTAPELEPVARTVDSAAPTAARARAMRHPKWSEGLEIQRAKGLSQRDLAAELGMSNRNLAKEIIDYVKETPQ